MRQRHKQSGFTLLEILLALAVAGTLLLAATTFLVSISNLWFQENDTEYFDRHVEGVVTFLETMIAKAEIETDSNSGEQAQPVSWQKPPGASEFDNPYISAYLRETPPVLRAEGVRFPGATVYLVFDRMEGLGLLWHTQFEKAENLSDLRFTVLSRFVKDMLYCYYDEDDDSWEELADPMEEDGQYVLPDFLKLTFVHPEFVDENRSISVFLPKRGQNVLFF